MDQNTKKKIIIVRDLIKKEKYQQALQQAQILIYKNSKLFQAHLMAGLCYDKVGKLKEAEKAYKQVLDLKPDEANAIKALSELYVKMGKTEQSTKYMEQMVALQKTTDPVKYMQNLVKLVGLYQKNLDMEKIDPIFNELVQTENQINEQFVSIAEAYFKTGVTNQCFFLDHFVPMGLKGQSYRPLQPNAKQRLNNLLVEIVRYLYSVKINYKMTNKDIATSIYDMKQCFPYNSCFLMLFLLDDYIVSQAAYNSVVIQQIYLLLIAFYDKADNCYLNFQTLQPEYFTVSIILSYEFLAFMKEFFILDEGFNPYYQRLQAQLPQFRTRKVREEYANKIQSFILKECRTVSKISENQNIENRLESLKYRIVKLDGSYLEQVVAKMAMNCFVDYQKLCDMRTLLKTRINNLLPEDIQPHLYKYYYDYLMKIAKLYKSLDEELSIYKIIEYIKTNDDKDLKYLVQYCWIEVGKNSKKETAQFLNSARNNLVQISQMLPRLTGSLKSHTFRKQTVLKILLQDYEGVLDGFKLALGTDRCFENLECIGFYYFIQGNFERALRYLKQAFIIKQDDYHLNRAIFVGLVKTNQLKQAYSFLERIYEGFPNVYWINYALAMNCISNKKIESAYKYLSASLESFLSGVDKKFHFSYEKTIQGNRFSLIYMIDQNQHHILYDHIIVPEKTIFKLFPYASSLYFQEDRCLKQIRIETQLGEMLKILGRNKSSYNHLASAYSLLSLLSDQQKKTNVMQVIATKKEFATMLFYVRAYKDAGEMLKEVLKLCSSVQAIQKIPSNLLASYESEINSLIFQVSVMRLDDLMKFESYESVQQYILKFTEDLKQLTTVVKKPSLNYYKAKYQFYILCYLHDKMLGINQSIETIKQFLNYFGLDSSQIQSDKFYNRFVQLSTQQRIIVKECLEDYYVLLYMRQNGKENQPENAIVAESVLPLIQLFPMSTVFYIVYGMAVKQNKLKIAAFLKCIQLDRESSISVDLLASLFLKEKDYVTSCKLFLKSLQIDLFNPKSYIGLCTCLYALIGSSIRRGASEDKDIIRKALNKINSYMEFLRITDPSQNYHMLKFLKTLISDEPVSVFDLKTGLQQSRKLTAHKYSHKLLFQLLQDSTQYLKQLNIWTSQGQKRVLSQYLSNNHINSNDDLYQIAVSLLAKAEMEINDCHFQQIKSCQIRIKHKCKILNKACIIANIFCKTKSLKDAQLKQLIKLCSQLEEAEELKDEELVKLQKNTKEALIAAYIRSQSQTDANGLHVLEKVNNLNIYEVFKHAPSFTHIQVYLSHFTKQTFLPPLKRYILRCVHLYPCDPMLRKCLMSWLLLVEKKNNKSLKKVKHMVDYRFENILQMNTDQQANNCQRFHKKFAILYNIQEPNAWIGFISEQWRKRKQTKWLGHLDKIVNIYSSQQNLLSKSSKQKTLWLITEMAAAKIRNREKIDTQQYPKQLKQKIQGLSTLYGIFESGKDKQLSTVFNKATASTHSELTKQMASYLVSKYEHNKQLEQILDLCIQQSSTPVQKGYYYLLKFVSICSKPSTTEDQLVDQLTKLVNITSKCSHRQQHSPEALVHQNSVSIMKCMTALLSLNYEQLEMELNNAYGNRLVTYSDQVVINYFEVLKSYREVQTNHQGENVFENFTYFVDCMISMSKQPYIKGFFYSLKAMAGTIVADESSVRLSRQLKYAMLLSPVSSKSIIARK